MKKIPDYDGLLRILCDARFKTLNDWTEARFAIVDTGAHTSLLPLSLWRELDVRILGEHHVRGLVPKEECRIDVNVGWVRGMLVDKEGNSTPEIEFRAFLAQTDNIPLIVGFKDLLEKFDLDIDASAGRAFIKTD